MRVLVALLAFSAVVAAKKEDENECEGACSAPAGRARRSTHWPCKPGSRARPQTALAPRQSRRASPCATGCVCWRGRVSGGAASRQHANSSVRTGAVCKSVISAIDTSLSAEDRKSEEKIEKAMFNYCKTAKLQDKKLVREHLSELARLRHVPERRGATAGSAKSFSTAVTTATAVASSARRLRLSLVGGISAGPPGHLSRAPPPSLEASRAPRAVAA